MTLYMYVYGNVSLCSVDVGSGEDKEFLSLHLSELQRVGTLGMGGFGRVELVGCKDHIQCFP